MATTKSPVERFQETIQRMDPLLAVRWGDFASQWVVERKAPLLGGEVFYLTRRQERLRLIVERKDTKAKREHYRQQWIGVSEELESARRGCRVILITKELKPQVYDMLCAADMQRYGGYARIADQIEAREAKEEADKERMNENERTAIHSEVHSMLNFIWRKRDDDLCRGERDMQYLLHGTRKRSEPLIKPAFS